MFFLANTQLLYSSENNIKLVIPIDFNKEENKVIETLLLKELKLVFKLPELELLTAAIFRYP